MYGRLKTKIKQITSEFGCYVSSTSLSAPQDTLAQARTCSLMWNLHQKTGKKFNNKRTKLDKFIQ